jgi:hypothetical protein
MFQVFPVPHSGMQTLEWGNFIVTCFTSRIGVPELTKTSEQQACMVAVIVIFNSRTWQRERKPRALTLL